MSGLIVVFFVLTLASGLLGFGGLGGAYSQAAEFLAVFFVALFVASIFYRITTRRVRRIRVPLP